MLMFLEEEHRVEMYNGYNSVIGVEK